MRLENRVALITGGGSGIGRAIAEAMAHEGAQVVVTGRRKSKLAETVRSIEARRGKAGAIPADITRDEDAGRIANLVTERAGRLDLLVHAAGAFPLTAVRTTTRHSWDECFDLNVRAVFFLTQRLLPLLEKSCNAAVINISSTAALTPLPNRIAYCVSKAALNTLTRCLALELAPQKIRVAAISPGIIETEMTRPNDDSKLEEWRRFAAGLHPLGRLGTPEEIAKMAVYLASDDAEWITGANFTVDGGIALT